MSKTNICLYGLAKQFTDNIGQKLAEKLDIFYANFDKIFEFEIMDSHQMEEVCGRDYLVDKEKSILKRLCTYENTMINIDYSLLNSDYNLRNVQTHCLIIYIKLDYEKFKKEIMKDNLSYGQFQINLDLFQDRDNICEKNADIVAECKDLDEKSIIEDIILKILKYYDKK